MFYRIRSAGADLRLVRRGGIRGAVVESPKQGHGYPQGWVSTLRRQLMCLVWVGAFGIVASACTNTVHVASTFPVPVVEPLALDMGLYYDEALLQYAHKEELLDGETWVIELGEAHIELFDQLFGGVFEEVIVVPNLESPMSVDAIIQPNIEDYVFVTPTDSGTSFYEVSIRYNVSLYTPSGELITAWPINGYGRSRAKRFKADFSVSQATTRAMRDAAAILALEIRDKPELTKLLHGKRSRAEAMAKDLDS